VTLCDRSETERDPEAMYEVHLFVDGARVSGRSGRSGDLYMPATGERTAKLDFASREEVDRAVTSVRAASARA
jgi:malonate-semialdehyde dehydrogenase (acetylating)/methylmalonate-semialdehyde dehydrogenase